MAQDNTPAIVMYKGPQEDGYSIPFDKGYYGEVKVAFVRRGLTDYEYMPTTYTVEGALYAWEISKGVYYYTKSASPAVDATVYNSGNQEISGVKVVSTQNASASFSDGKTGIRSNKKDIHSHALLFWTGEPLGNDDWICIVRETVKKQPYSYPNNQKHIEGALDNLSRQIQELKAQSDVSLKVDPTFVQDPAKMNPIDWLDTIVRSTDTTARGLRYRNFWLEYSTDDPNKAESDKSWTKLLNTTNVTTIRQLYNEEANEYYFQYSMDGGASWLSVGLSKADIDKILDEANAYSDEQNAVLESRINGKLTAVDAQIDANADAIQKTREDFINADSEIHQILNNHAENLTTLHNDVDDLGDQVAEIESKIPESASASNQLATKADLKDIDLDGYVKKSGDTMTGPLTIVGDGDLTSNVLGFKVGEGGTLHTVAVSESGVYMPFKLFNLYSIHPSIFGGPHSLGADKSRWDTVYATKLNNGVDIVIPSVGGTLARIEDLIDLRADINEADSELQTQITAQAAEIATKQDQLVAGDNIVISGNTISATGAGGGVGFDMQVVDQLPATGKKGVIYLVPKDGSAPDVHDEYVWIDATQTFELIGTTQVDLTEYVKNTDYATASTYGVVKVDTRGTYGVGMNDAAGLFITSATETQIAAKTNSNRVISPKVLDYAVKVGVTTNTIELTDEEKTAAQAWLGIDSAGGGADISHINNESVITKDLTVGTDEGTINIGVVAGTATIATNNGLDIVAQTKFDTAPTTDDNTTYANALDTSLVRKAQVATAIADAMANVDALPDQAGNAGKFLQTNGATASWAEVPAGGTKVIIKRYS